MTDNKELATHSIYCPKCGRLFQWRIAEEPKYNIVILFLRCNDCGTSDSLALSRREFLEMLLGGKNNEEQL